MPYSLRYRSKKLIEETFRIVKLSERRTWLSRSIIVLLSILTILSCLRSLHILLKDGYLGSSSFTAISKQQIDKDPKHSFFVSGFILAKNLSRRLTDRKRVSIL